MFVNVFVDWENVEKTVKQDYGSIVIYEEFFSTIRKVLSSEGLRIVAIQAYGDFDRGTAGLMSRLVNLGVEPHHVVTKSCSEFLKNSADIELSLDILETSFNFPHITHYLFISGDSDLRYVIKRLRKQGKHLLLMGFRENTSQFLIDLVNKYIPLDSYPNIMRKVTASEKEQTAARIISDKSIQYVLKQLNHYEKSDGKDFIGLNYFRKKLLDNSQYSATHISDSLTDCIDNEMIITYQIPNPKDSNHPTRACKINKNSRIVKSIID